MDVFKNTVNGSDVFKNTVNRSDILKNTVNGSDVFKSTVNGCIQVLETTSETDPLLIVHRVVDIADVDD